MKFSSKLLLSSFICLILISGCQDFVDIQPKGELEPRTVPDLRKVLDDNDVMNNANFLGEIGTKNVHLSDQEYQSLRNIYEQNAYIWNETIYPPSGEAIDWDSPYKRVYYANLVLNRLPETNTGTQDQKDRLRGEALYHRSDAFFQVALLYAKNYQPSTASEELGIPLRTKTEIHNNHKRASLEKTYSKISSDLEEAVKLLPQEVEELTRPSKAAAHALLARVYLNMEKYGEARQHALASLDLKDDLIDFNQKSSAGFQQYNKETIFYIEASFSYQIGGNDISQDLYNSYQNNDLRKDFFFTTSADGALEWEGSYTDSGKFTGPTTAEMYLIAAETYARDNQFTKAEQYLNELLQHRYESSSFTPFSSNDEEQFLQKIIEERRKELAMRNRRWFDLKRFNNDPRFSITLQRTLLGETYTLSPDDPRYVLPIPPKVIQHSNLEQNQR